MMFPSSPNCTQKLGLNITGSGQSHKRIREQDSDSRERIVTQIMTQKMHKSKLYNYPSGQPIELVCSILLQSRTGNIFLNAVDLCGMHLSTQGRFTSLCTWWKQWMCHTELQFLHCISVR